MTGAAAIVLGMQHVITFELDLSTLRRAIGGGSYVRGAEYARQQAVLHTTWDAADTALHGMVRGQGGNVYQTAAFFTVADGRAAEFEAGECSCPIEYNCKHVVALVLSVLEPGPPEPLRPQSPPPAWSQSLDSLLDHGGPARGGTTPLAIELALTGGAGQPRRSGQAAAQMPLRLMARLVRSGKNGGWVAGDLNWGKLDTLGWFRDHSDEQVRLLRELYLLYQASGARGGYYGYHYGDDRSIEFSSIGSRQLWPLLDEAAAADLQLVYPGRGGGLAGYEEASFCLDVTRGEAGGLQVVPVIRAGDEEPTVPVAFIGAEGHGAVCVDHAPAAGTEPRSWRFRLVRLARTVPPPLQRMALGGEPLTVPAAGEHRFRDWYYPRLRQAAALISSDGSFSPPAICGPDLVLKARYGSGHELELSWAWAYRVGDSPLRAPLEAGGPDDGYRDPAAERALLAGLDLPLDRYGLLAGRPAGRRGGPCARPAHPPDRPRHDAVQHRAAAAADRSPGVDRRGQRRARRLPGSRGVAADRGVDRRGGRRDRLVRSRRDDHRGGTAGSVPRCVPGAQPRRIAPAAAGRGLFLPRQAGAAALRPADRGGAGAAGLAGRPAADQPVPGRVLG